MLIDAQQTLLAMTANLLKRALSWFVGIKST